MKNKKLRTLTAFLLAVAMMLSLAACGGTSDGEGSASSAASSAAESESTAEAESSAGAEAEETNTNTFPKSVIKGTEDDADEDDNTMSVVNEVYASYYQEGSSAEGVAAIISAGNCYVNGAQVPATEEDFDEQYPEGFTVNGSTWMTKNEDGTWSVGSGYAATTVDGSYAEAATEMLKSETSNGSETLLYDDDGDGYADRIESTEYRSVSVTELVVNDDGTYTIDLGTYIDTIDYAEKYATLLEKEFGGETQEIFQNISAECFDESIQSGDCAVYYLAADGNWYFLRATEVSGVFNDGADHQYYTMDGVVYPDTMNGPTTTYSAANRSGGYSNFIKYFGLNDNEDYTISMWLVPVSEYATSTGKPLGFTSNDSAIAFLETAIAYAQEQLDNTVISEDGSDVEAGKRWVSADLYNELSDAVTMAQAALDAGETRSIFLDYQCYLIYMALHGTAGDITAQYTGYNFDGFENYASEYYTLATIENEADLKLSDSQFDSYFEGGSAAEGLKAVVEAGGVYVNNYQLTAEEATFEVNGQAAVYEADGGWAWSAQEQYTGTSDTYADAAYSFAESLTGLEGQTVQLLAKTGSTTVAQVKTTVVETAVAYGTEGTYAVVYYTGADGAAYTDGNGEEITFDSENGSSNVNGDDPSSIYPGDIYIYWKDANTIGATSQWVAIRAAYVRGTLSGTEEEPLWTEEGSSEAVAVDSALVGGIYLPEDTQLSAFLGTGDTITMWYLPTDDELDSASVAPGLTNRTIGFTTEEPESGEGSGNTGFGG
ncbi:MAG: hypothetical protein LUF84_02145 [Clostridiales bacterium]|nr:hypothetical protein [Clostridiales bacterium]